MTVEEDREQGKANEEMGDEGGGQAIGSSSSFLD